MTDKNSKPNFNRKDRNKVVAIIAGTSLLIGATFGVQAIAESKNFQHARLLVSDTISEGKNPFVQEAGWSSHEGRKGWFGKHRRGGKWANMSDEDVEKHVNRIVRHVSIEIDATPEQEQKITSLLAVVAKDMRSKRKEFRAAGEQALGILMADTVDRAALEKVRAERMAEADRLSKNMVTAIADVADVLSLEQRKMLNERVKQLRSMRRGWHRG